MIDTPLLRSVTVGLLLWAGAACAASGAQAALSKPSVRVGEGYREYVLGRYAWSNEQIGDAARYFALALQADGEDSELLKRTFELALASGDTKVAVKLAQELLKADPQNTTAELTLIAQEFRDRNYKEAEERSGSLSSGGVEAVLSPLLKAWAALGQGDKARALSLVADNDDVGVTRSYRQEHAGHIKWLTGDIQGALSDYQALIATLGTGGARLKIAAAAAAQKAGRSDQAAQFLDVSTLRDPHPRLIPATRQLQANQPITSPVGKVSDGVAELFLRASVDLSQEKPTPLSLIFARLATMLRPDLDEASLLSAEVLRSTKNYSAAMAALSSIAPSSPLIIQANVLRAQVLLDDGKVEEGVALLKRLADSTPDTVGVWVELGDAYRRQNKAADAARAYDLAISKLKQAPQKEDWSLFYLRGVAYEQIKRWDLAEPDLRRALTLNPGEPNVLNYLGYSMLDRHLNLEEAKAMLERAVAQRPGDGTIVDSLGWAYFVSGNYDEAVKYLEQAIAAEPGEPTINEHLGDAYWKVGRTFEARYRWQAALDSDPEEKQSMRIARKLDLGLDVAMAMADTPTAK